MSAAVSLECACSSAVGCMFLSEIAARITAIVHKAQTRTVKIMVFFFHRVIVFVFDIYLVSVLQS